MFDRESGAGGEGFSLHPPPLNVRDSFFLINPLFYLIQVMQQIYITIAMAVTLIFIFPQGIWAIKNGTVCWMDNLYNMSLIIGKERWGN